MLLWPCCKYSLEKHLFKFFAQFLIVLCLLLVILRICYIIYVQVPYEIHDLNIFSQSLSFHFTFLRYSFFPTFFIVVQVQWSPFPPTPAIPTPHPWFYPRLALSMCPLYLFLKTLPLFPTLSPPTAPLVTVSLFLLNMVFLVHKRFYFWWSLIYLYFGFDACDFSIISKNPWSGPRSWRFGFFSQFYHCSAFT